MTTQSVARRGGFAEGTIYRHFESRDELIIATLRDRFRDDFADAVAILSERVGQGSVEANLREFMTAVIPLHATIAPAIGMLAADPALAAKNADALREDCRGPRLLAERVAGYFRAEQQLGRVWAGIDPAVAAGMLISTGFYRGLMLHLMGEDPIGLPEAELAAAVAVILSPAAPGA